MAPRRKQFHPRVPKPPRKPVHPKVKAGAATGTAVTALVTILAYLGADVPVTVVAAGVTLATLAVSYRKSA